MFFFQRQNLTVLTGLALITLASLTELIGGEFHSALNGDAPALSLCGTDQAIVQQADSICFDSALPQSKDYCWGAIEYPPAIGGDFHVELDFEIEQLDHWNSLSLNLSSAEQGAWSLQLARTQEAPGQNYLVARLRIGDKEQLEKIECNDYAGTFDIARQGSEFVLKMRSMDESAPVLSIAPFQNVPETAAKCSINFDSAAGTRCAVKVRNLKLNWSEEISNAYSPTYAPFRKLSDIKLLALRGGKRNEDQSITISSGGRAILSSQSALTTRSQILRWESDHSLRIKVLFLGNAESLQLSDLVVNDAADESSLAGKMQQREINIENTYLRFASERNWSLPHFSSNNIIFYQIEPTAQSVTLRNFELWGHELEMTRPFVAAQTLATSPEDSGRAGVELLAWNVPTAADRWFADAPPLNVRQLGNHTMPFLLQPTMLSPECPSIQLELKNQQIGRLEILHAAGQQQNGDSPIVATCLLIYEDGTTETLFFTLRWNCGVYQSKYMEATNADNTWWGPPAFGWADACYMPQDSNAMEWNTLYQTSIINPHPEKAVSHLTFYQMPGDAREYLLTAITTVSPEHNIIGLIEPEVATFSPHEELAVNAYEYRSVPAESEALQLQLEKTLTSSPVGSWKMMRRGNFGAAMLEGLHIPDAKQVMPGPVRFRSGEVQSSLLGLMSEKSADDKPFYYMMIAGGHESPGEWERIYRNGYDAVKIHLPWVVDEAGEVVFPEWTERFERIRKAKLKIAFRNLFTLPEIYRDRIERHKFYNPADGSVQETQNPFDVDITSQRYRDLLIHYYAETAKLAVQTQDVIGINTSYGQRDGVGELGIKYTTSSLRMFHDALRKEYTLEELNRRCNLSLQSFEEVTPEVVWNDASHTLLPLWCRAQNEIGSDLIMEIAKAIRNERFQGHLTCNVCFHPAENPIQGQTFGAYLRMGRDFAPGSLFHETSDRYCLSFVKWLAAKRTLDLPYGDEGCQPPPTREHNTFAYLWMAMMQCYEANYCQWWGGKPAHQNIAWLKPFHQMLYQAEYLPDQVSLALSLQSGFDESPSAIQNPLHTITMSHYSLANVLRELNINADRYMIDEFPELDANVTSPLVIDDIVRAMPTDFGDRIEQFMRKGGIYLASLETDRLNEYAFFKRFGIHVENGVATGQNVKMNAGKPSVSEVQVGQGKLLILNASWNTGSWHPASAPEYRNRIREILTRAGGFQPLVGSSATGVLATPYRAKDGALLIFLINISCESKEVTFDFADSLIAGVPQAMDLTSGAMPKLEKNGARWQGTTTVEAISGTVIKVSNSSNER